jgi:hypothetical protein
MPHFECGAIDHSATSPGAYLEQNAEKGKPVRPEKVVDATEIPQGSLCPAR